MFETLENRRMLTITIAGSRITIDGTADADNIYVDQVAGDTFYVFENGTNTTVQSNRIVRQIVINGDEDDDTLYCMDSVMAKATLNGDAGCDTLTGGYLGDKLVGGDDVDTADYSAQSANLRLSINGIADDGRFGEGDNIQTDVENIIGGAGNDLIVGSDDCNELIGGIGNDTIKGRGENDLLVGGEGNDSLEGQDGDDVLVGNEGTDTMQGGAGCDLFEANDGEVDVIVGGSEDDEAWVDCFDNICADVEIINFACV